MKNYEYQQLVEMVKEVFCDFRIDAIKIGESTIQVIARFFDNYGCVIEEGECEAAIVCSTLCIELLEIQEKTIYLHHKDKLLGVLNEYNSSKLIGIISGNEIELLNKQIKEAIRILEGMRIIS